MQTSNIFSGNKKIRDITGSYILAYLVNELLYWFKKYPDGFYKFIGPCKHRAYKKGDSWAEVLGCAARHFSRLFDKIGTRYTSKTKFLQEKDPFKGKPFVSYYDRDTNQMYFLINYKIANTLYGFVNAISKDTKKTTDDPVTETCEKKIQESTPPISSCNEQKMTENKDVKQVPTRPAVSSYIETTSTQQELSLDNSHAKLEIEKKMIEIWMNTGGKEGEDVTLTRERIAFLKKAFKDKFDRSLEKWKAYCERAASSKFLMGEKTSFKADLDCILKFKIMKKIFEGQYGIGDRRVLPPPPDNQGLENEIKTSDEPEKIKQFRIKCLYAVGGHIYTAWFKNLSINFDGKNFFLVAPTKFIADYVGRTFSSNLRVLLEKTGNPMLTVSIYASNETRERFMIEQLINKNNFNEYGW